jgi:hypothetical protein
MYQRRPRLRSSCRRTGAQRRRSLQRERDEVVIVAVARGSWGFRWVVDDLRVVVDAFHELEGCAFADVSAELWAAQHPPELCEQHRARDASDPVFGECAHDDRAGCRACR